MGKGEFSMESAIAKLPTVLSSIVTWTALYLQYAKLFINKSLSEVSIVIIFRDSFSNTSKVCLNTYNVEIISNLCLISIVVSTQF